MERIKGLDWERIGLDWKILDYFGKDWIRLEGIGLDRIKVLDWTGLKG